MVEKAAVILALIAVLILIVVTYYKLMQHSRKHCKKRHRKVLVSEAYPQMKTGDIILYLAHAAHPVIAIALGELYTHGGFVVETPQGVGISEATYDEELAPAPGGAIEMPNHATIVPALLRLKHYRGTSFWMRLSRPLGPDQALAAGALAAEENPYPGLAALAAFTALGVNIGPGRNCFEHISWILGGLGLIAPSRRALLGAGPIEACRKIIQLPGRALADGYQYLEPVELVYDIGGPPEK